MKCYWLLVSLCLAVIIGVSTDLTFVDIVGDLNSCGFYDICDLRLALLKLANGDHFL
jgi:hypothetical protein